MCVICVSWLRIADVFRYSQAVQWPRTNTRSAGVPAHYAPPISYSFLVQELPVMPKNALTITDQRNDKTYEAPVELGTIRAMDLRKIKTDPEDFGLMTYDPAFMNTACCKSNITFIDGDKGILRYRGYDIEALAEKCTYLQVAYLLFNGELPTPEQDKQWNYDITHHTMLHESTKHGVVGDIVVPLLVLLDRK